MGHFSMEKSLNPGSVLGGNQQACLTRSLRVDAVFLSSRASELELPAVRVVMRCGRHGSGIGVDLAARQGSKCSSM
jgi:hypothetical protein